MRLTGYRFALGVCGVYLLAAGAVAQWNPSAQQWGKTDATDVRIMAYNILDHVCSTTAKTEGSNAWCALARIVAALKPDVLMLEEAGDNSGNGTGSGVDSVATLTTTLGLFLHGGSDPYLGGTVTAYVQKYAPDYDLPYIWVSSVTDGYNRNVIVSRFPFADLNGDTVSQRPIPVTVNADLYAWGPPTGIRGFMFGEFDLPDATYTGDLVVGCAHLKAGGTASDRSDREREARNIAYYIDYLYNGGGTTTPDPRNKISDLPAATKILDADTPVVIGGDWNEDEATNGRKGPAEWLSQAEVANSAGGMDGPDRDRSDMTYDNSVEPYSGSRVTQGSSKLDYLAWQDSIATLRRSFVFYSAALPSSWYPTEIVGFASGGGQVSVFASDHRPVVGDFILPLVSPGTGACCQASGVCSELSATACAGAGGTYQGDGTVCSPNPCPQPTGACCQADGTCSVLTAVACAAAGGAYQGDNTGCSPNSCPQPTGACCQASGTCSVLTAAACAAASGTYQGAGTVCTPNPCAPPVCRGDANCDGNINWRDIDFLIAAMNDNEWNWEQQFLPNLPNCPFANNDANQDGSVNWRDIDPFVARMNLTCP